MDVYIEDLEDRFGELFKASRKAAGEENEISGSALLVSDPTKAAAIQAVADGLARWKVAIASGTDPHPASLDLGAALAAAPTC